MDKRNSLVIVVALLVVVSLFARIYETNRPAETWDEFSRYVSGLNYMYNIAHGYFAEEYWNLNIGHPPVGKYIYGMANGAYLYMTVPGLMTANRSDAVAVIYEHKNIEPGRYASAAMGVMTVLVTFVISYRFIFRKNIRPSAAAALILSLLPVFMAHTRLASLDSPGALFFSLSVWLLLESAGRLGRSGFWPGVFLFSFSTGLAVATKLSNMIMLPVLVVFVVLVCLHPALRKRFRHAAGWKLLAVLLFWIAISSVVFCASWPRLWNDPVGKTLESLSPFVGSEAGLFQEYFMGQVVNPPVTYYAAYLVFTTPLLVLILLAVGIIVTARRPCEGSLLMLSVFFVPLIAGSVLSFKVGGLRYMLIILPAMAILAAAGLEWLLGKMKLGRKAVVAVLLVIFAYMVAVNASVHPYYLDYYNELSAGPGSVFQNRMFIIGYWGEGLDEAMAYINSNAAANSTLRIYAEPMHVVPEARPDIKVFDEFAPNYVIENGLVDSSKYYQRRDWSWHLYEPEYNATKADYALVNTYYRWYVDPGIDANLTGYTRVFSAGVLGADFADVYRMNK